MPIRWDKRNKRWRYEFDRYIAGVRHRASRLLPRGWSQAQADKFDRIEGARLYALATGVEQADPLIEQAVALYLRDKTHLKSYKAAAEHLGAIAWAFVGKPTSALPDVAKSIRENTESVRKGRKIAEGTVRNRLALLKAACRHAWKAHALTPHDPTTRMQIPDPRNERHVYADRREMLMLARAAERHEVRVMIRTAFYSGMRLGEMQRVAVKRGLFELVDSKNGDRRTIPVHDKLWTCLRYLPLTANKRALEHGFHRARLAVGMPHVRIHDLRHSAASEMVNAGANLYTVGKVLGHRDPRSTARYSHLTGHTLAEAIGKIGRKVPHNDKPKAA